MNSFLRLFRWHSKSPMDRSETQDSDEITPICRWRHDGTAMKTKRALIAGDESLMLSPRVIEWTIWMTSETLPLRALSDLFCTDFLTIFFCTEHRARRRFASTTNRLPPRLCHCHGNTPRRRLALFGREVKVCGRFTAFTTPAPLQSTRQSITPNRILLLQLTESQQITSSDSLTFSSGSNERAARCWQ